MLSNYYLTSILYSRIQNIPHFIYEIEKLLLELSSYNMKLAERNKYD